ncbi:RNase H domain-containing protein [Colletotrichum chrysophilum]|uniref:ribonuclease H n=1 Tax=Colletotrichum chrysophilum TaxID=1836956 RepID=A0AAD8ZXM1_9PEZI|nr:RNase H domain-containing protein [Colletotrichum chrysophilum]
MSYPDTTDMTLSNGQSVMVCTPHHQVVCGKCCVDFSFDLNEGDYISSDDEGIFGFDGGNPTPRDVSFAQVASSKFGRQLSPDQAEGDTTANPLKQNHTSRGMYGLRDEPSAWSKASCRTQLSGSFFPTAYWHPEMKTMKPIALFPPGSHRFKNYSNPHEMLVYVDGACSSNGTPDAIGGCGFVFKSTQGGSVGFRLEDRGVDGQVYRATSNRAELRAALGALKFRAWHGEGFRSLVIATDSVYVAQGATDWARGWIANNWRPRSGKPVKNRDLWEALLLTLEKLHEEGLSVSFWRIPREWNSAADQAAKKAISTSGPREKYGDILGVMV